MARKVDIVKAFNKLPYESKQQIENVLSDDGQELISVEIQYLINEVKWTIERMNMDIIDGNDPKVANDIIKGCERWLKYYKKYI